MEPSTSTSAADVGMGASRPPLPSLPTDPSQTKQPHPASLQHHWSSSNPNTNPNPDYPQPGNMMQFNMQPAWVGSQQLHMQSSSSGMAVGIPANSVPRNMDSSPSTARPSMPSSMGMIRSQAVGQPHPTANPQPNLPQNLQGHGMIRAPSVLTNTSTPSTSQSQMSARQPWLSSQQGRPSMPSSRPQATSQTLQQRTHNPQQSLQPVPTSSQPQQTLSFTQQPQQQHYPTPIQSQVNSGQQFSSSRNPQPQPVINQQQISRVQTLGNQRPPAPVMGQASIMHPGSTENIAAVEAPESCTRILSKRSIQELVYQVDPLEKLDPEVEDVLVDIADDFIDSVTTFGCSLAKHRKSNTLEAKDILLHLERTWNMTLPGFTGDEIKTYKKPVINDIHKERLAVIKRSS